MYRLPGLHICNSVLPLHVLLVLIVIIYFNLLLLRQDKEVVVLVLSKVSARRYCNYCTTPRNVN